MPALRIQNLTKHYGEKPVFTDISFDVYSGERIGLIGRNGSGKTTLFKAISGLLDYDSGNVLLDDIKRMEVLEQIPSYPPNTTVEQVIRSAFSHLDFMMEKITELEKQMAVSADSETLRKYDKLRLEYQNADGYIQDVNFNKTVNGLSLSHDFLSKDFSTLSGGEKTKVNLARIFLSAPDILLLDEPTNHLDMSSIEWVEEFLQSYKGIVIAISHDRYFLDSISTKIVELERCKIAVYTGNYSEYMEYKEQQLLLQEKLYENEQREAKRLKESAEKLLGWGIQTRRLQRQGFVMQQRAERLQKTEKVQRDRRRIRGAISESTQSGYDALSVTNLSAAYSDKELFSGLSLDIKKGECIALLGDNGTGKSSLFKVLLNEKERFLGNFSGRVKFGSNVNIGILEQIVEFEHPERNLVDTLLYAYNITPQTARDRLAAYDFIGEEVFKTVDKLSGGERSRLKLCLMSFTDINFLLLDEPTNHLDIISREWLEESLGDFDGTMLFISHDRYFINRFADRILVLADGELKSFDGDFEAYKRMRDKSALFTANSAADKAVNKEPKEKKGKSASPFKTIKDLERKIVAIEKELSAKELELAECDERMARNSDNYLELEKIALEQANLSEIIDELYNAWENLQKNREKFEEEHGKL